MSLFRVLVPYIAAALASFLLALQFWQFGLIGEVLLCLGVLAAVGGVVVGIRRRPDPYDLASLQQIHEREELFNLDVPDGRDIDQVQCLCCQRVYAVKYPACPHCAERR